jgi:hypothetical protein
LHGLHLRHVLVELCMHGLAVYPGVPGR